MKEHQRYLIYNAVTLRLAQEAFFELFLKTQVTKENLESYSCISKECLVQVSIVLLLNNWGFCPDKVLAAFTYFLRNVQHPDDFFDDFLAEGFNPYWG